MFFFPNVPDGLAVGDTVAAAVGLGVELPARLGEHLLDLVETEHALAQDVPVPGHQRHHSFFLHWSNFQKRVFRNLQGQLFVHRGINT